MHRDIRNELQRFASDDLVAQQTAFDVWRKIFNEERPHEALGMKTPAEVYHKSKTRFTGTPDDLLYEGMLVRRVKAFGTISLDGNQIFISTAFAGCSVGLKYRQNDLFDLYFANLRLGEIDRSTASFVGAAAPTKEAAQLQES